MIPSHFKQHSNQFLAIPLHLETTEAAEMLKKVMLHSVATAFASIVLPVPGGPYTKIPSQGRNRPVKRCGYFMGKTRASLSRRFECSSPVMSEHATCGLWVNI